MFSDEFSRKLEEKIVLVAWRTAPRFGLDRDDLAQESYRVLWQKQYDPKRANGRTWEKCLLVMVNPVVLRTAVTMYRRSRRMRTLTSAEMETDLFEALGVSDSVDMQEQLDSTIEVWIREMKSEWRDTLHEVREDGHFAWHHANARNVRMYARRAGLLATLVDGKPHSIAMPVLQFCFDTPANEIASFRSIGVDAVYQCSHRFRQAVKRRSRIELKEFALGR